MSTHTPEEVPSDAPGSGENMCRNCVGTGKVGSAPCAECGGSGKVQTPIGGG